jgi:hypothetical protein
MAHSLAENPLASRAWTSAPNATKLFNMSKLPIIAHIIATVISEPFARSSKSHPREAKT